MSARKSKQRTPRRRWQVRRDRHVGSLLVASAVTEGTGALIGELAALVLFAVLGVAGLVFAVWSVCRDARLLWPPLAELPVRLPAAEPAAEVPADAPGPVKGRPVLRVVAPAESGYEATRAWPT